MKRNLFLSFAIISLFLSSSRVYSQETPVNIQENGVKVAVMEGVMKDLVKKTLYSVGSQVLNQLVAPTGYVASPTTTYTYQPAPVTTVQAIPVTTTVATPATTTVTTPTVTTSTPATTTVTTPTTTTPTKTTEPMIPVS